MSSGKFFIARLIFDDPLFAGEEYTRLQAWLWMVGKACWKRRTILVGGRPHVLERGQFRHSLRHMAERFRWSPGRTQRFIGKLRRDAMIETATDTGQFVITICNYEEFSPTGRTDGSGSDTGRDTAKKASQQPSETDTAIDTAADTVAVPNKAHNPAKNGHAKPPDDSASDTGVVGQPIQEAIQYKKKGKKEEGSPTTTTESRCTRPHQRDDGGNCSIEFLKWTVGDDGPMVEAAGSCLNHASANLERTDTLESWLNAGADFDRDVLAGIRNKARGLPPNMVHSWGIFSESVAAAVARRTKPLPEVATPLYSQSPRRFFDPNELFTAEPEGEA